MSGDAEIFTFQYGSTLIFAVYVFVSLSNFFTFQYGSTLMSDKTYHPRQFLIYIPIWFYFNKEVLILKQLNFDLHSNMVLL